MSPTNEEIIVRLYSLHYNYCFMVAYNICKRWDIAEDIVQDSFIGLWESKEAFMDVPHARRYVTGIIKNAAFKRLNKESRQRAYREDFLAEEPNWKDMWPLTRKAVTAYLYLKSPLVRHIIKERYIVGKSQVEIARQHGVSRGVIKRYEEKGIKYLSSMLERA